MINKLIILILFFLVNSILSQPSRIELISIYSPALGINKNFNIYLPAGYDSCSERYPVVYLFRGHEREWANRNEDGSRMGRNILDIADLLYQNGDIGKMILVMPGVTSADNTVPGLGVNMINVSSAFGLPGLGTGQFEDYLLNDLIPYVDTNYRTLPTRTQRGIDGFSLGGYTSMMLACRNPELFISAGSYDGTLMWLDFNDPFGPGTYDDFWMYIALAEPAFGLPRDTSYMALHNPANIVTYADSNKITKIQDIQFLIQTVGAPHGGNSDLAQHMVNILNQCGIQNAFPDIVLSTGAVHNWWYADEHMLQTLPLHWTKFQNTNVSSFVMEILSPLAGSEVSGNVEIIWSPSVPDSNIFSVIDFSRDDGRIWNFLIELPATDSTYSWNTLTVPDGARYQLRVRTLGDTIFAVAQTPSRFTINNPGNANPEIEILSPAAGDVVSGEWMIDWFGDDADGDSLTYSMSYSIDNGNTWQNLFINMPQINNCQWNSSIFQNSPNYQLVLSCWDDSVQTSDTSDVFEVFNPRIGTPDSTAIHIAGNGSGTVSVNIADPDALTGNTYQISFDDTSYAFTTYDIQNITTGNILVSNASQLDGTTEGPLFEGLRLLVKDYKKAEVDLNNTGWLIGNSTLEISIYLPQIDLGGGNIMNGFPYPADYQITVYDHIMDTSSTTWGAAAIPMKFLIYNITENQPAEIIYLDNDGNNTISRLDELYIIERDSAGGPLLTWAFAFGGQPSVTGPAPGDEYLFKTLKPFTSEDIFEFSGVTSIDPIAINIPNEPFLYQNYPNPFNPTTTIKYFLPTATKVSLKIYNILGQEIRILVNKNESAGIKSIIWDGKNKSGNMASSGLYFYRLQANKTVLNRKMILMK